MKRFYLNVDEKARTGTFLAATLSVLINALPALAIASPLQSVKLRSLDETARVIESPLNARQLLNSNAIKTRNAPASEQIANPTLVTNVMVPSRAHRSPAFTHPLLNQKLPLGLPLDSTQVKSAFGLRIHPIKQRFYKHKGIDFSAPRGTPVLSTADGWVSKADARGGTSFGKYIVVAHPLGYSTVYAHLDEVQVTVGSAVKAREVIGKSGNTGRSSGPHLHYEIRYRDEPIDPQRFLSGVPSKR